MKAIVWFRRDLRKFDNLALYHATQRYKEIYPVYINDLQKYDTAPLGGASKVWLYHSLEALNKSLDNNLNLYLGDTLSIFKKLLKAYQIQAIFFNRVYEHKYLDEDQKLISKLEEFGVEVNSFNSSFINEPGEILKEDNTCYKIFTPYLKASFKKNNIRNCYNPDKSTFLKSENTCNINDYNLLPTDIRWDKKIIKNWDISEQGAEIKLNEFIQNKIKDYDRKRDFPSASNISNLSPYLHFGQISPVRIWHKVSQFSTIEGINCERFLTEILWREFFAQILYFYPDLYKQNMKKKFDNFKWNYPVDKIKAWQYGKTGYPIVDAGMRELRETGTMHNRVRMICASFLVKNLLVNWQAGAEWFMDNLFDADLASNSANWQWVAGSGTDAAPYFRIFNPVTQAQKFDQDGEYVKKFVHELRDLPAKYIFEPWKAPASILKSYNIKIGVDYPLPIVDLKLSRMESLRRYSEIN